MLDVVLNFLTTYVDPNGDEVFDMKVIARNYLKGSFWVDFIASVPLDNFWVLYNDTNTFIEVMSLTDMLKLIRILRLARIIRFTRAKDDIKAVMNLMQLMLYLIMWVHLTGCLWYIIIKQDNEWLPVPDYITKTTDLYETSIWGKYFASFYHAVWLLTGGEVGPRNVL